MAFMGAQSVLKHMSYCRTGIIPFGFGPGSVVAREETSGTKEQNSMCFDRSLHQYVISTCSRGRRTNIHQLTISPKTNRPMWIAIRALYSVISAGGAFGDFREGKDVGERVAQ